MSGEAGGNRVGKQNMHSKGSGEAEGCRVRGGLEKQRVHA
jgi:hypothetical protein